MLDWLEESNDPAKFSKRLTSQTYTTLHHTVYGLLELPYKLSMDSNHGPSKRVKYGDADFEATLLKWAE
ncbi:unnamed protein product [Acanthoscelides obtectus]|uniref:Uncharacterized protein n=1 Tax=Acanthoscelides obtectus TaxID=200917 RepID=A0A9P0PCR8_ACAOB|nr:unnamed protein product [Acanthoscelides obtectus]CAK1653772.1 hypothetical protein AOBTE_LOCUS18358 [Acanthoscelides obtectus]